MSLPPVPLRVAVLGAGMMGLAHVDRISNTCPGAYVSAVVEPDAQRRQAAVAASGGTAEGFDHLDSMIRAGAADAVLVASPGQFHEAALHATLDAGLPTLCEKPLTLDVDAARRIVDHEMTLPAPLIQVGFHRRYDAGYRWMRELIESGAAGGLLALHCRHRNPTLPQGWDDSMLVDDAAAHEMDIVAWLANEPVVSVEVQRAKRNSLAPDGVNDPILLLLRTSSGVLADVEVNMSFQAGYQVSTEAVLEQGAAEIGRPDGPLRIQGARSFQPEHHSYVTRFADAYDSEVRAWVKAIKSGKRTGATAWDGYRAVLLCQAGRNAQQTGDRVLVSYEHTPDFYRSARSERSISESPAAR